MTPDQLRAILPASNARADYFADPLTDAMDEFEINTPARQASFIAQVGHESGQLRYVEEIASGRAYEGRRDLGNIHPGDGVRFKGRGLIQITGRGNYAKCGDALGLDLLMNPELLSEVSNACRSAAWFWKAHGLNELADAGDQVRVSKAINCGSPNSKTTPNGLADRLGLFERAKEVLL